MYQQNQTNVEMDHWNQSNNHVKSSQNPLMDQECQNARTANVSQSGVTVRTGAATRLGQMVCVPKPYKFMANNAPVAGSLRVWQL